ncbi:S-adenosyl-L-methionine-dependent methyltransferase [Aspergillus karnatakaensis]|uniref:tRNA (adenine-N(1)-)-methyltransferase n=1 Tax=Aspergillus karnatakaensis TaxID=1810916 RepID=UPI003CCD8393
MARLLRSLRQIIGLSSPSYSPRPPATRFSASINTDFSIFKEGDRALILGKNEKLTGPLQPDGKTVAPDGNGHLLQHKDIIGQRVRNRITTVKAGGKAVNGGRKYYLRHPTLEEYVSLTPRFVTPIYAHDTNLIVSLLDIHVNAPSPDGDNQPPLEILESGTGHGSLTLQLSRAIQAANTLPPTIPPQSQITYLKGRPIRPPQPEDRPFKRLPQDEPPPAAEPTTTGRATQQEPETNIVQQQWDQWRAQRRAIIHTVDVSPTYSAHAEALVRGFRRGIYAGNVDFYVGHVENWIQDQIKRRAPPTSSVSLFTPKQLTQPFLTHAILDMPSASLRLRHVVPILKNDGFVLVFCPSITQLGECAQIIQNDNLPLTAVKFVELGTGISGGREWDVRLALKKSRADPSGWETSEVEAETAERPFTEKLNVEGTPSQTQPQTEGATVPTEIKTESVLVCRPKVGARIVGGGFVGVWRRKADRDPFI